MLDAEKGVKQQPRLRLGGPTGYSRPRSGESGKPGPSTLAILQNKFILALFKKQHLQKEFLAVKIPSRAHT